MLDIRGLDIIVSKGDTEALTFEFEEDVPPDNTSVVISLKRYSNNNAPIWTKSSVVKNGEVTFQFSSEDTNHSPGIYKWDMMLTYTDGEIYHPMVPANFQIVGVVSSV